MNKTTNTTTNTSQKNGTVLQKIDNWVQKTTELPQSPIHLLNLLRMTTDVQTFSSDLVKELAKDSELAEKIVYIARVRQRDRNTETITIRARDIQQSIQRLGYEMIHNEVAVNIVKKYNRTISTINNPEIKATWKLSIRTALIAKEIAKLAKYPDYEMAFFLGLINNIGKIVIALREAPALEAIQNLQNNNGMSEKEAEIVSLGFDNMTLASKLLRSWDIPEAYIMIGQGEVPRNPTEDMRKLSQIMNFANYISECLMDENESSSHMWLRAQDHLDELKIRMNFEDWHNKVGNWFINILSFEDRIFMQKSK